MLQRVKALLKLQDESMDAILQFYIDDVQQAILDYCNIDELPSQLEILVIKKVMELYKGKQDGDQVKSIQRGDVRTEFVTAQFSGDLITDLAPRLKRYRKPKGGRFI